MQVIDTGSKKPRSKRTNTTKETAVSKEETDLATHVELCSWRYKNIEEKFETLDARFDKLETEVKEIKASASKGFSDIKELIEKRNNSSHTALITAAGTVIVSLIGFLGYLITHVK